MTLHRFSLAALLALSVVAVPALALELGDAAAPLKVEKWIKGGPIDLKDGQDKNIYVIEFWATWCGPCRRSIPHLTELQKKYKDKGVVVIGLSTDEDKQRKTRKDVEPFVETMGEKMDYAVALDDKDGSTEKAYMDPFLLDGYPSAFIIDKAGKIVFVGEGYPMPGLDEALEQIIAGKYDLKAAQKADKERRVIAEKQRKTRDLMKKYFDLVSESEKPEGAEKLGKEVLAAIGDKDANMLNQFAWDILTKEDLKFRDLKLALRVAKAAYDASAGKSPEIADTYARALWDTGSKKEAVEYQKKAVKLAGDNEELRQELEETLEKYEQALGK